MKEYPFGFEYNWEDLRPIRPLAVVVLITQTVGSLLGLWLWKYPELFENLLVGGAAASFPGYIAGMALQKYLQPNSLSKNKVMVRRLGFVALLLSVVAVFFPPVNGVR